jgi:uncharacterized protein (TIGR03086 family)
MVTIDDAKLAFDNTARIVQGVRADQWQLSTPCAKWNVRDVVNHVTGVMEMFEASTRGEEPPHERDVDVVGDDPVGAYVRGANATIVAWRARGLDGTMRIRLGELPAPMALTINTTDAYLHGWDVAQATGQDSRLDETLCEELLAFMANLLPPSPRNEHFGEVVDVADGAPASERLLAYSGRTP